MKRVFIISFVIFVFLGAAGSGYALSERERELLYSINLIERGQAEEGIRRIKYLCEKQFYTDACDYLKKRNISSTYSTGSSTPVNPTGITLDQAFKWYNAKNYTDSFPVFDYYCKTYKEQNACFMVALSTRFGYGTMKNPRKALAILTEPNLSSDLYAQLQRAYVYEYDLGSPTDLNRAFDIYKSLLNCSDKKISDIAIKSIARENIYSFLSNVFNAVKAFYNDKMDYERLERILLAQNTSVLPAGINRAYTEWRLPFLKLAKNRVGWGDVLWETGKGAVKGFIGDFSFIGDALNNFSKSKEISDTETEEKHYFSQFIDQLDRENISSAYWNQLIRNDK